MTQLLIQGETILARGPFELTAGEIKSPDAVFPKHVIPGYEIQDLELPADFTLAGYFWDSRQIWKKPVQVSKEEHNASIDAQILDLEGQVTSRRLREAILLGDTSFISDIDDQIAALRYLRLP